MIYEIERRFLVDPSKLKHDGFPRFLVKQAYLAEKPSIRARTMTTSNNWTTGYIAVKGNGTIKRPEFEYTVPTQDALDMMTMARFGHLLKYRFVIHHARHSWEVDQFLEKLAGLWLAEIPLSSETEQFEKPEWVGREVTEDPRYSNASLAKNGLPSD